jgi:hypothetical protein
MMSKTDRPVFVDANEPLGILGTPVMAAFLNSIIMANKLADDPDTTGWSTDEAPYFWFNTTDKKLKMWNGEEIVLVA